MSLEAYSKKRFLIVDELDSFCFSTKKTLKELGLKLVDSASSAKKVILGFENINYDVVLCNYELGKGKNGQELLEELRYRKLLKYTGLFFIISAEVEKGKVMGTVENEPDGYLVKPVTPKELKTRLLKSLAIKDAMRLIDDAIDQTDYHSAIKYCDRSIAQKSKYSVRCLKTKAWLLSKTGQFELAKEVYQSILNANDFTWAEYGLAKVLVKQKEYSAAEELLNKIIAKDPNQLDAMDLLAEIYKKQNNVPEAKRVIKQALDISPNALLRQKELADICILNNESEEAINAFRNMHKLSAQSIYAKPEQYYDFANYLANNVKDDESKNGDSKNESPEIKEALELLAKSEKKFSAQKNISIQTKLMTANVNAILGKNDEAQAIVDELINSDDKSYQDLDAKTLKVAATALKSLGQLEKSEQILEHAADVAQSDPELQADIYEQLNIDISLEQRKQAAQLNKEGIKLYANGNIEESAAILRSAQPLTPRHISLNLNLAQVLLKLHKQTADNALLNEIEGYLNKIRHTPEHHKEFKRLEFMRKQFEKRQYK